MLKTFNFFSIPLIPKNMLNKKINFSFEFFPPKDIFGKKKLLKIIKELEKIKPIFFSITHSVKSLSYFNTDQIIFFLLNNTKIPIIPHLTYINFKKAEIQNIAKKYLKYGIKSVLALRGDLQENQKNSNVYSIDLIKILKEIGDFKIFVAAYPEIHPESSNMLEDLENLKKKKNMGANTAITQFFFSIEKFLFFKKQCLLHNVSLKIIPGILPILSFQQLLRFKNLTNVFIPPNIFKGFLKYQDNSKKFKEYSINFTVNLILKLFLHGVTDFHIYTLNRIDFFKKIFLYLQKIFLKI
ncbi:methylenetetrahydrofolate reductase [Buchnera aphidicola]|uniref:methylenetetrahydrofolate reductase n=1 Tax=Buchnera aphidicola TaxID=9 RepID=UPI0031B67759